MIFESPTARNYKKICKKMIWEIEFLGRNYYITNKVKPLIDMKTKIITTILYVTAGLIVRQQV